MLGKWYYGLGQKFSGMSEYEKLEEPHEQAHQIAHTLIKAIENGNSKKEIAKMMREFSKISSEVMKHIQELENKIL